MCVYVFTVWVFKKSKRRYCQIHSLLSRFIVNWKLSQFLHFLKKSSNQIQIRSLQCQIIDHFKLSCPVSWDWKSTKKGVGEALLCSKLSHLLWCWHLIFVGVSPGCSPANAIWESSDNGPSTWALALMRETWMEFLTPNLDLAKPHLCSHLEIKPAE